MIGLGYLLILLSGLSLGLIGGGGALLSTPVLIYFFKMDALQATTYSLFIVAITSAIGTHSYIKKKHIDLSLAIRLAFPCFLSIFLVRHFLMPHFPKNFQFIGLLWTRDIVIMLPFGLVMGFAAFKAVSKKKPVVEATNPTIALKIHPTVRIVAFLQGLFVGTLTGFVGVGGGFILTPILHYVMGLEFKRAVGTSLFVLTLNTTFGFCIDMANGASVIYTQLIFFSMISLTGLFVGFEIAKKITESKIKMAFSVLLIALAATIIIDYSLSFINLNSLLENNRRI